MDICNKDMNEKKINPEELIKSMEECSARSKALKCPFDQEEGDSRKYYLLAGGNIELQSKGDGSTARILAKLGGDHKDDKRFSVNMLTMDEFMETMADAMHVAINNHTAELQAKEWIPISEELPKKDGRYLITNANHPHHIDVDEFNVETGLFVMFCGTHWQHLPKELAL